MSGISIRSFLAGAVLAGSLTLGGMVLAHGDGSGEKGGGMMGMMSQMQAMMSKCNAMMDDMDNGHMMQPGNGKSDSS